MPERAPDPTPIPFDDGEGVYANSAFVWQSEHDVAIDFRVVGPPDEDGERVAATVVRVRLPRTMLGAMLVDLWNCLPEPGDEGET